jgi:hypothetical protein
LPPDSDLLTNDISDPVFVVEIFYVVWTETWPSKFDLLEVGRWAGWQYDSRRIAVGIWANLATFSGEI